MKQSSNFHYEEFTNSIAVVGAWSTVQFNC